MKYRIKLYFEKEAFEQFLIHEYTLKNMLSIISEHSELCMNISESDLDKEWKMTSLSGQRGGSKIQKFCTGHNLKRPVSACAIFQDVHNDNKKLLDHSRSVFFLNVTPEVAEEMRLKYGVMVISKDGLSDDFFQFTIKDSVYKNETKKGVIDGWDYFFGLRKHKWLPSNALVFSDDHMFDNDQNRMNLGVRNLKSLIKHLLPQRLESEFQILVVSQVPRKSIILASNISKELVSFIKSLSLPYTCKITFVFSKATHTRKIISNYCILTCDKGFSVYMDNPQNQVHDTNFIDISSEFHSVADSVGTSGYDDATICLQELKKKCQDAQSQILGGIKTVLISGDCGPNYDIINRLFD